MKPILLLLLFQSCASLQSVMAQAEVIDQSYTPVYNNNFDFYPTRDAEGTRYLVGQEFTPNLSSLNFVDLYVDVTGNSVFQILTLYAEIHSDTIDGPLLGTSLHLGYQTDFFRGEAHLTFADPISLTPGQRYVIRPYAID